MFAPKLLREVRQGLLFSFSFKEYQRPSEQQVPTRVHHLAIDLSEVLLGKAVLSCAKVDSAYCRFFTHFREMPHVDDLSLTTDVRRMCANDALARHLSDLSE